MDPEKVQYIFDWKMPNSVKDVQAFLEFSNFYRQFVEQFSQHTRLLTELTKGEQYSTKSGKKQVKYHTLEWTKACKKAFENLKHAFTTAPVLAHYNAILETWVETNFSNFVTAGMLSQMHNGMLWPVAFFLKNMSPAECNYMIYNKELLVIVKSFKMWRPELASVDLKKPVKMYIDHKNLKHFMTTKQLNCWQACWAKFLSEFNFKISYKPGKQGEKPDILIYWSQDLPKGIEDLRQQHQFQTLLQDHQLDKDVKKALTVTFCVNIAINKSVDDEGVDAIVDANEENKEIIDVKEFFDEFSDHFFSNLLQQIIPKPSGDGKGETDKTKGKLLEKLFKKAYKDNDVVKDLIDAKVRGFRKLSIVLTKKDIRLSMRDLKIKSKQLYVENRM